MRLPRFTEVAVPGYPMCRPCLPLSTLQISLLSIKLHIWTTAHHLHTLPRPSCEALVLSLPAAEANLPPGSAKTGEEKHRKDMEKQFEKHQKPHKCKVDWGWPLQLLFQNNSDQRGKTQSIIPRCTTETQAETSPSSCQLLPHSLCMRLLIVARFAFLSSVQIRFLSTPRKLQSLTLRRALPWIAGTLCLPHMGIAPETLRATSSWLQNSQSINWAWNSYSISACTCRESFDGIPKPSGHLQFYLQTCAEIAECMWAHVCGYLGLMCLNY